MPPSGVFKYTMDEDALIEAEIAHELEFINLDAEEGEEDNVLNNDDMPPQEEEEDLLYGEQDVPKEASDYIKRIQDQSSAFERELAECDELLYRSKSVLQDSQALVPVEEDPFILELAKERGESPTTYKKRVLEELENDSMDLTDEPFLTGDVVGLNEEDGDQGGSTALVLLDEKTLEFQRMFRSEMETLERRQREKEEQMKMEMKEDREKEEKETEELEVKWKEKYEELQKEEITLVKEREAEQMKFEEVAKKREQEIEAELHSFQCELDKMEAEAEKEKEEFIKAKEEERRRQGEMEERGAVTIQKFYRGHVVRKQYREVFHEKSEERKKRKEEERIKEVEKELQHQREEMERKKMEEEEERLQKEKEERLKKEEEERLKREEEERLKREEEERLKREEEERLRKEDEEKQRIEKERQEKLKLEEEKRKEEERKREELRMKEEKKKKEEEERRAEEEAKRKEEERKREEAEKKRIEEEKRKEELKKKLEEEERRKAEEEEMKRQEEEKRKLEEQKRQKREAEEKLRIEKEELLKEKQIKDEGFRQLSEREEVLNDKTIEDGERQEFSEHNAMKLNGSARDKTFVSKSSKRKVEKTFVVDNGAMDNSASDEEFLDANEEDKIRNKAVNGMIEGLPDSLEKKRLQWIKDCTPWSKVSNEPWKLKPASSKRAVRRPSSAKKLSPLNEKLILSAAHAATLRQVTTVELHDLPGCSVTPLGQCWGLKHLTMTNCNLTVIEGLQQCKQLQYVNLKDNKIEYVDMKDLGNITYVNLCSNNLSVIHGLSGCTNVRWLDLSHNKITRLGGLDSLRRIHTLILSHNQLISTSCLSDTPTIQYLDISNNHLQKIEDIDKLCLLQTLKASSNNLLELLSLENQVLLQELIVDDNSIASMDTLQTAWLPLLHTLNISQNSLEDLISLEQFHVLKHLDISTNQILEPDQITESISGCVYLESLYVSGNPAIEDSQLQLSDKFPRLSSVDHNSVWKSHDLDTPIKPHNSFQAMCLTQIQFFRDMYLKFIQEVKQSESKSPIDVSVLCDTYFKFCDKSHKVACDHRYAHEYGDIAMAMPVAPSTPKSGRPRSSRSAKLIQKDDAYQNPKDLFNKAAGAQSINNSSRSFEKYSDPKDLFEKAVSSENSKNSSQRNYVNGGIVNEEEVSGRNGLRSEKTVVITAKTVKDLMEKDQSVRDESVIRNAAATKIQAHWRGYSLRKYLYGDHDDDFHGDQADFDSDMAVLQQLHKAATKIQAVWRGYILRLRLERAIEFARLEDDDEDFLEVDLDDFNFNEDVLDDWRPPTTPQIPSAHPVLGKPPSGKQGSPPGKVPPLHLKEKNLPPVKPQRAWRGAESPRSDIHQNGHMPRPPPSVMSGTDTHRTVNSKKEEKLSEEWGFKDTSTAHLMMQRAKKMKYNSERRKKLSKLDPKQRLALFRRLEETGTVRKPQYVQPSKQTLPRKEYFQARQEEIERKDLEKRVMHNFKNNRTYEWIHTQVGDYEVSDSAITHKNPVARGRYGSEGNLPRMDPDVTAGRPPRLVASPSLDVQSVDSVSLQGEMAQPRRFSAGSEGTGRFPPIKTSSAGSTNSQGSRKRERMSWRNKEVNKSIGWGGGKKRGNLHE